MFGVIFATKKPLWNLDLNAWKKSRVLVKEIYEVAGQLPADEKYGLSDQLRRAVVSVASNLAEGGGRISPKEKLHFCQIAYGSLMEVTCQLTLAMDLGFISETQNTRLRERICEVERMLRGYHNYLKE